MSNHFRPIIAALAITAATLSWSLTTTADDSLATHQGPASAVETAASTPTITAPPYRRVPDNFGKIGLSTQQREDIYAIRGQYRAELAELQQRIEELENNEMSECEAVLTDSQRTLLQQLRKVSRSTARD